MNVSNNKKSKKTKKAIENTFLSLLKEHNIEDISVSMISAYANVNRSTFYLYYNNIYDLLEQIELSMMTKLAKSLKENSHLYNSDTDRYLLPYLNYIYSNQDFFYIFYSHSITNKYEKQLENILYSSIKRFIDKTVVVNDNILDYCLEYYETGLFSVIKKWILNGCIETPEEIAKIINICTQQKFLDYKKVV